MGRDRSRSRERDRRDKKEKSRRSRSKSKREDRHKKDETPAAPKVDTELRTGRQVMVHGLQKNTEKNGAIGVLGEFNQEKGRWMVEFSSGQFNNFKAENLQIVQETSKGDDKDDIPDEEIPTSKVYITNLSGDTVEKDLIDLFGGMGMIEKQPQRNNKGSAQGFKDQWPPAVKIYKPGKAGGDACLEYVDKLAAKAAVKAFNGYRLKGSTIGVAFAGSGKKYEARNLTKPWAEREENQPKLDF